MINRDVYLNRLIRKMWNGSVKIITGIRRSGKSYLLNTIFYEYLINNGTDHTHIIRFAFDSAVDLSMIGEDLVVLELQHRKVDYRKFMTFIASRITAEGRYIFLLDEIQRLEAFEYVLNGYLSMGNIDIYVTGSNSKFLSSDIITEFRGRGDEIHVMPLSFSEYYGYMGGNTDRRLDEYMTYGGLPGTVLASDEQDKMQYLTLQIDRTYLKDVIDRNHIKSTEALDELFSILASGIATLTNPTKLERRFRSEKKADLSADTISKYISFLKDAFILERAVRYDIKGKTYINTPYKIYFEDIGLRNARLGFRQIEYTHLMENVIFNELRYRGYRVDVGTVEIREGDARKQLEVDFVANMGSERIYIQSAFDIPDHEKEYQEIRPLDNIPDSFKKIVILNRNIVPKHSEKGYLFLSLSDFLLKPDAIKQ